MNDFFQCTGTDVHDPLTKSPPDQKAGSGSANAPPTATGKTMRNKAIRTLPLEMENCAKCQVACWAGRRSPRIHFEPETEDKGPQCGTMLSQIVWLSNDVVKRRGLWLFLFRSLPHTVGGLATDSSGNRFKKIYF